MAIATRSHEGQRDKSGAAYIGHPLRVMAAVDGHDAKVVAVLHDVVEDSGVSLDDLRAEGFSETIVAAVDALTKRPGEPLEASMARVVADPLAARVKLADVADNSDAQRLAALPPETRARLLAKYRRTLELLTGAEQPATQPAEQEPGQP
nr:bifunctional (p)ppGpp synthetase/guanosine-3',5'-bis(diphosphate) 3'-pyrophosphohydrolase [Compostimonas suwonensis]